MRTPASSARDSTSTIKDDPNSIKNRLTIDGENIKTYYDANKAINTRWETWRWGPQSNPLHKRSTGKGMNTRAAKSTGTPNINKGTQWIKWPLIDSQLKPLPIKCCQHAKTCKWKPRKAGHLKSNNFRIKQVESSISKCSAFTDSDLFKSRWIPNERGSYFGSKICVMEAIKQKASQNVIIKNRTEFWIKINITMMGWSCKSIFCQLAEDEHCFARFQNQTM